MSETDRRLIESISGAYAKGNYLGLALATGFLCLLHALIMLLGFVILFVVTLIFGMEDYFFEDVSFISFPSLFAWLIGAYVIYLYRTNSTFEKWTERIGYPQKTDSL